jgi:hypothetical protein
MTKHLVQRSPLPEASVSVLSSYLSPDWLKLVLRSSFSPDPLQTFVMAIPGNRSSWPVKA